MDRPQITHYADPHTLKRIEDLEAELAKTQRALELACESLQCVRSTIFCPYMERCKRELKPGTCADMFLLLAELAEKEETDNE